ncbi:MAG: DUF4845 domain-containing protein [Gammaproteobacteria bacterium]|nr:DUF4845 domain-containing protein [Gammaproteobacteria bacterium]
MRNHRQIVDLSRPRGLSTLGIMGIVGLLAAVVVLTFRLAPHYSDFQTLSAVMDGLSGPEVHGMAKRDVYELLLKRFKINNLREFTPRDVISIDRNKLDTTVDVFYEIREPIIGNVEVILVFEETYSYR